MEVLLALSVTIQVKILTPLTNVKVGLSFSTLLMAQLSEVVGVPTSESVRTASQLPESVSTCIFTGGIIVGGIVSLGITATF